MTWDTMSHTDAKFENIVVDEKKRPIGFTLKGMTYDGDGNPQDERGTEMEITMKNEQEFKQFIAVLNSIKW